MSWSKPCFPVRAYSNTNFWGYSKMLSECCNFWPPHPVQLPHTPQPAWHPIHPDQTTSTPTTQSTLTTFFTAAGLYQTEFYLLEIGIVQMNGLDIALITIIRILNHTRIRHGLTSDIWVRHKASTSMTPKILWRSIQYWGCDVMVVLCMFQVVQRSTMTSNWQNLNALYSLKHPWNIPTLSKRGN